MEITCKARREANCSSTNVTNNSTSVEFSEIEFVSSLICINPCVLFCQSSVHCRREMDDDKVF